jgi:NitT/TauT family transport system substrate-binding protein
MKRLVALACVAATLAAGPVAAADRIRMLAPTWLGFAPVHVANDLGYFAKLGLEVDYKFEDDRANVMAAMARGDIEVDMRTVGEHQGRPRDAKTPGVIIGTIDQSVGGDGVITDDAIKSAADLKGKTVAAEPNIPARLLLQIELKKSGLTLADLHIKDIASADLLRCSPIAPLPRLRPTSRSCPRLLLPQTALGHAS